MEPSSQPSRGDTENPSALRIPPAKALASRWFSELAWPRITDGRQMGEGVGMEWMSWLEGSLPILGGIDDGSGRLVFGERIA
ncbi:hypothetical protein Nepgr_017561 [Nepenthes gracilis]|uniref:Uncharacterized protein n=1 Tax=Nepenthes gracilis TaxID=150966 RepID=A0AAD3XTG6_NEPGR|nr:hypothetical protein Nepgr_017561 [Nepenthes gracilis]